MSFAIIETGGKQYKVSASKILEIEKLNAKVGETIKFQNVLLLNDDKTIEIGNPSIAGATVEAKLLDNVKDRTVLIFHKRRRKHSRKKNVIKINLNNKKPNIPTTIADEIKTNIFFKFDDPDVKKAINLENSSDFEIFSKLRDLKDNF